LNVSVQESIAKNIISKSTYQKPMSFEFIKSVKEKNIKKIQDLLNKNPYLVFDFD